jgi:hypothetical protein
MLYYRELLDLNNPTEGEFILKLAGESLRCSLIHREEDKLKKEDGKDTGKNT